MNTRASLPLSLFAALLALAGASPGASAGNTAPGAKQSAQFVAGVRYMAPAYKAGAKFRTAEAPDAALVEDAAKRLQRTPSLIRAEPAQHVQLLGNKADVLLVTLADDDPLHRSANVIPTGHVSEPMAIMRTDTDIKRWEQLKGRSVCVAEGGAYAGTLAARYGAIEKVFPAPADALLALRAGRCDAAVHDKPLLEEMLKLPEWKKFSARLTAGPGKMLAFVVPAGDAGTTAALKQVVADWRRSGYLRELTTKAARNIAFEVYLDQDVPDCH